MCRFSSATAVENRGNVLTTGPSVKIRERTGEAIVWVSFSCEIYEILLTGAECWSVSEIRGRFHKNKAQEQNIKASDIRRTALTSAPWRHAVEMYASPLQINWLGQIRDQTS